VSSQLNGKGDVHCSDRDIAELVPDDSQLSSWVRRRTIDKLTAKALWDLSEKLTDLKWQKMSFRVEDFLIRVKIFVAKTVN
jgi:hypothetical protein